MIYLDHNATTPTDPRVVEAMLPYFADSFGNPSSAHSAGCAAAGAVDKARGQVAALIGADPREVVWTSGATEANNLAIKGVADHYQDKGRHIVTAMHEHRAVIDPCRRLAERGYDVTWLRPAEGSGGRVTADQVAAAIRDDTILVSVMWANNEVGTINDVPGIGAVCHERGVLFHTDATQAVGKLPIDVNTAQVDLLSASAHKLYGPKGVGCLYVRRKGPRARLTPLFDGGGHERTMRSGTTNVPGVVGFGVATELAMRSMDEDTARIGAMRDRFESTLRDRLDGVQVNGDVSHRLFNTSHVAFAGVDATRLLRSLPDLAASTGSACSSATLEPSYVLRHLGLSPELAAGAVRFSLGRATTAQEVDDACRMIADGVNAQRAEGAAQPGDTDAADACATA